MRIIDLGRMPHDEAEAIQLERVTEVGQGAENTLYVVEHPPTITVGTAQGSGGQSEDLHVSQAYLEEQGIALRRIKRGGKITCHFPGQLVLYPVFQLAKRPGGVRQMFSDLERVALGIASAYGLEATQDPERPGLWVGPRKIASVGIGVKRWVSYHGLALNVERDLSLFSLITLCGLPDVEPTSITLERERLGLPPVSLNEVKDVALRVCQEVFASA